MMTRSHGRSTARSTVTPALADEDDDPLILRRTHPDRDDPWFLADDDNHMPVKTTHFRNAVALCHSIEAKLQRCGQDGAVYVDLAWRWDRVHRARGVDPDVMLVTPAPPEASKLKSLRAWAAGHHPPCVAFEIVSDKTARKDYLDAPGRYGAARVRELVVFDPDRHRVRDADGPYVLQVWRRARNGKMVKHYAGDGPCKSAELKAWLVVIDGGLRIAEDAEGKSVWPTHTEREQAEKIIAQVRADTERKRAEDARDRADDERAEKERERTEKERALLRVEEASAEKEAAQRAASRMLTRSLARRLGRTLTETEQRALDRRLAATAADVLDEETAALADEALERWLSGQDAP